MNIIRYSPQKLLDLLQVQKVATMPQLKDALGSSVTYTVLRKLSPLGYRSSYSHNGTYYTLDALAHYDELGLWSWGDVHFSRQGTLLNTAESLVTRSPAGYQVPELEAVVHVAAKDALRQLAQAGRIYRRDWQGRYWYGAQERTRRQEQWAARQAQQETDDDLQAATALFYSLLDEQQRRLYDWMWTPWPGANASCWAARCCAGGFGNREAAGRRWKKNARNPEPTAPTAPR